MAGYSGTPLIKKLGIKPNDKILLFNEPENYLKILGTLSDNVQIMSKNYSGQVNFVHFFAEDKFRLHNLFPICKERLDKNGMLWASWIKQSSKLETDISESEVRKLGLELDLVDVKICAVDEDWSALKFVYRKKDR